MLLRPRGTGTCGGTDGSFEISGLDVSTAYDIDYLDDGTLVTVNLTSDVMGQTLVRVQMERLY
jgi:hypothetical protein